MEQNPNFAIKEFEWNGFNGVEFEFEQLPAKLIKPNRKPNGKWLLKTEYFDAFPETEIELLKRGWHLAYNQNNNRWAEDKDLQRKSAFLRYIPKTFGLDEKCVLVGMSCGGLYSVKLTALNPELIRGIYLDAPVMNLLSCPGNLGKANGVPFEEYRHFTGRTIVDMLSYREHPIDKMHILAKYKIPIVMVAGDSDTVVPYEENGGLLEKYYKQQGLLIDVFIKPGANHHPHGLKNPCTLADIIDKF